MPAGEADPEALYALAAQRRRQGGLAEAERAYRDAIAARPDHVASHRGLVGLLRDQRRWEDALAACRAWLAVDASAPARLQMAFACLELGRFDEGWPHYEARTEFGVVARPSFRFPEWRGEPLTSILLLPEQGFGDSIQFSRYVHALAERGVETTLACPTPLARLFAGLPCELLVTDGATTVPRRDYWSLLGSLPWRLGLPPPRPFALGSDAGGGGGIGVVCRGNPAHPNDTRRSLDPESAGRLRSLGRSLEPEDTGARDFRDTAELIAGLDLVISVDTAVAHLAATQGKPCWILLPALNTDWRWMHDRSDSPWYPSATLLRQQRPGDWAGVVDEVFRRLSAGPAVDP